MSGADPSRGGTALARRAPSHLYATAYRALLGARLMLLDPERFRETLPEPDRSFGYANRQEARPTRRDRPDHVAYKVAMIVSAALRVLPEFSGDRADRVYAACWKMNPATGERGDVKYVEATLVEVSRLFHEAAQDEAGALAMVPLRDEP